MKICIPTKDRIDIMTTHLFFDPKDVLIFVEPQEINEYIDTWPDYTFVNIEKNDNGIQYVRNFILNYATENIIMADDDIYWFGKRNDKYRYDELINPSELLTEFNTHLKKSAICGLQPKGTSYFKNKQSNNQRLFINERFAYLRDFVGINTKYIYDNQIQYDNSLVHGEAEDLDFITQITATNGTTLLDCQYTFESKKSSPGGLEKIRKYKVCNLDDTEKMRISNISNKWGEQYLKYITAGNRQYVRIDHDKIRKNFNEK